MDVFAWTPSDMPGVPAELAEHKLHVNPGAKPVKQGLRKLNEERRKIVEKIVRSIRTGKGKSIPNVDLDVIRQVCHALI